MPRSRHGTPERDPNSWSPSPVKVAVKSEILRVSPEGKERERKRLRESQLDESRSPSPEERCRRTGAGPPSRSRSPARARSWARSPSPKRRRMSPSQQQPIADRRDGDLREERSGQEFEYHRRSTRDGRQQPDRDNPAPNRNLGVFGLDYRITHNALFGEFKEFGIIENATVVTDPAGESRGFGFVKFERLQDAEYALRKMNGVTLRGKRIRVDYSTSDGPHRPTPGRYLGHGHCDFKPRSAYPRIRSWSPSPNGVTYRYR